MTIKYHDDGHGFPILWIHGFPFSSAIFAPQLAIEGHRHIRVDLPGFGKTPPASGATSMATYARDVIEVLDHLKIDRAVVGGLSMGGYVAMQVLRDAPQRVAGLILCDTRATPDDEAGRAARAKSAAEVESSGSTASVVDAMLPKLLWNESFEGEVRTIMASATPEGVVAATRAMAERPDSAATLRAATVPAFIVCGEQDPITPPADALRMRAMMREAELAIVPRASHLANYERPEQVNHLLAAWLHRVVNGTV
jgi:3-oxoadipate enol-lactonase